MFQSVQGRSQTVCRRALTLDQVQVQVQAPPLLLGLTLCAQTLDLCFPAG